MFKVDKEVFHSAGFVGKLGYISWDSDLFNKRIYSLSDVKIEPNLCLNTVSQDINDHFEFIEADLVITRIKQSDVTKINLLERLGFGFVELSYRPFKSLDNSEKVSIPKFTFRLVGKDEISLIAERSLGIFHHGRYHQDPRSDNALADERYKNWLLNAVVHENQSVLICALDGKSLAFFVIEDSGNKDCFLSLVAIFPEYQGKGLATPVWKALFNYLELKGYSHFSTSISSHNDAVFNLYVKLGFKFPEPEMTLHKWVS
ncbi:GNAT family N-acetyltransferase [Enterovibrio norvegicus]|uniref:GNAT family N-acetyltransferase n=1 Tax=Enterovibrio norvegicus TaxID=188144 RepID=UPI000301F0B3|nr:GNAT family N-acetyltransferase [Enterovibrio norvegicus]OEF59626.1 GNAT family N-acetyltransferase [Enterovibrio norvegicus]